MIHDAGWSLKFILVIILFICCFWIPIGFFLVWAEISRYLSIIFFVVEVLYILVGAYQLGDYMVTSETTSETWRNNVLLLYTIILTAGSVGFIVTSFLWFLGGA